MTMTRQPTLPLLLIVSLLLLTAAPCSHAFPRPTWRRKALMTRWLAHEAVYGVLSTVGEGGAPVGGVVSVADGIDAPTPTPTTPRAKNDDPPAPSKRGGRLFLYLSPMDELAQNVAKDPRVSLTLTQASIASDGCGTTDPEDPTCARVSFQGQALRLDESDPDTEAAKQALFAKHPAMKGWPDDHSFAVWEVVVKEAHLLDYYGGMAVVAGDAYYGEPVPPDEEAEGEGDGGGVELSVAAAR